MQRKSLRWMLVSAAGFGVFCFSGQANAQGYVGKSAPSEQAESSVQAYWTPERLASARPIGPTLSRNPVPRYSSKPTAGGENSPGEPPRITGKAAQEFAATVPFGGNAEPDDGVAPEMTSSSGYYFTTHRVTTPQSNGYPYITTGKLFFRDPRTMGNFVCTASVIRQRMLSTAGHCVAKPSTVPANRYFFDNFLFVPALNGATQPFGSWTWQHVWTTTAWINSTGSVPHANDIGMIEMVDKAGKKIWEFTGFLGFFTGGLAPNHLTVLGYPCNLDSCTRMQRTDSQSFAGSNSTAVIGSAMRGGSSGGPWIQDFGSTPTSSPAITGLGANYQRGNTSYGPIATEPKYQGASIWGAAWVNMKNAACARRAGNCTTP